MNFRLYNKARFLEKAELDGVTWALNETETLMYAVYDICRTDATLSSWYSNSTKTEFKETLLEEIFVVNNTTYTDDITNNVSNKIIHFLNEVFFQLLLK